jgi:uncharacterized membrane protein
MSDLIAIAYPDVETAQEVMQTLQRLQTEHSIELADAVIVERRGDGAVQLHQSISLRGVGAGAGAASGALWGGLIGLLFLQPLLGMAIGGATGAATGAGVGAVTDLGVPDQFMEELGQKLEPGTAAVFVLVNKVTPDKVLPAIDDFGGTVLHTSLSNDAEKRLQEALQAGAPTPA